MNLIGNYEIAWFLEIYWTSELAALSIYFKEMQTIINYYSGNYIVVVPIAAKESCQQLGKFYKKLYV